MSRGSLFGTSLVLVLMAVAGGWFLWRPATLPLAESGQSDMAGMDMPEMGRQEKKEPDAAQKSVGTESARESESVPGIVTIPPERLQTIGVKYEQVARRPLEKLIRTVGRVAVDERRLAKVTIKFHGWIEELFVSALGDHVKKWQRLFTIYSPDLVASQEEYLLALQGQKQLGHSEFPEVAQGSKDLLEAAKRRFQLWDITEDHVRELEKTGKVMKTIPIHSPITGTVIKKEAIAGAHVDPGQELYTIADLSRVWILADIYEYELAFVKIGQK
ncbi:MAG TPA: efflux RND transporter periplasmic adaptor subunit, partial [Nitrospira sp.]